MENQHRKTTGYRELDANEIALMNVIKGMGKDIGDLIDALRASAQVDQRWVSIGATDLQKGLMALKRSVAKPDLL